MRKNVGTIDRVVRFTVGTGLLSLTVVGPHSPDSKAAVVGQRS
jgi:hypothetical protein